MAEYSFEFKRMVVMEYLNGKGSYGYLAKKYGIADKSSIRTWVTNYNRFGENVLKRRKQKHVYTFEFKLHVVELYLRSELSYRQLAVQMGITNPSIIAIWVRDFRVAGPDALKLKKKGRKRHMDKDKVIRDVRKNESEETKDLLKQLQEENLKLRIENAFLKEARRLRLEEEKLLNELRESSTASEENSN